MIVTRQLAFALCFTCGMYASAHAQSEHGEPRGKGVPVLSVNGTVIHGYNEKIILAALK